MSDSVRLAVTLGLNRAAGFEPTETLAPQLVNRGPADALRALAAHRILLEAASVPLQLEAGLQAPEETRPLPRQSGATLLQIIFATESWLTHEALDVLDARGLRLPHAALAAVLHTTDANLRTRIAKVAGERGRWLAKTLNEYQWLLQIAHTQNAAQLSLSFEEGLLPERDAALRELRAIDSEAARAALQAAFAQEKADVRARLLAALEVNLSASDAPWLESLTTDRAASVQHAARLLLLSLPNSALRLRNRQVLINALRFDAEGMNLEVPESWPSELASDGLIAPAKGQTASRAFTIRVLASVTEPLDWLALSGLDPSSFVAALLRYAYFKEVFEGWMERSVELGELVEPLIAALMLQTRSLTFASLDYPRKNQHRILRIQLLKLLARDAWLRLWPELLRDAELRHFVFHLLPKPWPAEIALPWLQQLSERLIDTPDSHIGNYSQRAELESELHEARAGLAAAQFAAALALKVSDAHYCANLIQQFQRELELRARIYLEFYP